MKDDTAHALTPRNPAETEGMDMFKADAVSPLLQAFGGLRPLWSLDKWHPANISGIFRKHDQAWNLARMGLIKSQSSKPYDEELRDEMIKLSFADLADLPYPPDKLDYARKKYPPHVIRRHARRFYRFCRIWGVLRWPDAAKED